MSTTGHEEEFRRLFAQEAEQRLDDLTRQLLELEQATDDAELVAAIFREAHTLKGAAAVVGLEEVRLVTHAMETVLDDLRNGTRVATPSLIDGVLAAVDGLRALIPDVLAGGDAMDTARSLEAALIALDDEDGERDGDGDGDGDTGEAPPAAAAPRSRAPTADETVRVALSRLDDLVRLVGESAAANLRVGRLVGESLGVDPGSVDELRELSRVLNELQESTMRARMVPVSTITDGLHRAVRDVARSRGKEVRWEVRGEETELDRGVLQQLADPLMHMVRNAVDHGIESADDRAAAGKPAEATVRLHAMQLGSEVIITITDDGGGIDVDRVRSEAERRGADVSHLNDEEALYLVFRHGLSTATFLSDVSGRGVGLDVVRANVEAARGRIEIHSERGTGTEFRIIVPITLAVLPCLLVRAGSRDFAVPMHSVVLAQADIELSSVEGRPVVAVDGQLVPLSDLARTLDLPADGEGPVILLSGPTRRHAFRVGELVGQREVVVKELSRLLPRLDLLAGASIEPDGSILLVLDVPGLIDRARADRSSGRHAALDEPPPAVAPTRRGRLLVVDDAMTVRELQRSILERAGYDVVTAVDGVDALSRLVEEPVDLVLTDVEMPRMDGFALTEAIRAQPTQSNVPVLILTSRASEDDRQRGLEAGADGYIIKSAFDETALLAAVERLLGR